MLKIFYLWELVLGSLFVRIYYEVISRTWYISTVEVKKYYYKLESLNKYKFDGTIFSSSLLIGAEHFWQFIYSRNSQLGWNPKDRYIYKSHILTVLKPVRTLTEYWFLPSTNKFCNVASHSSFLTKFDMYFFHIPHACCIFNLS